MNPEIVLVYTKYDNPATLIRSTYFEPITEDWEFPEISFKEHRLKYIEEGLEGVKYYHYGE